MTGDHKIDVNRHSQMHKKNFVADFISIYVNGKLIEAIRSRINVDKNRIQSVCNIARVLALFKSYHSMKMEIYAKLKFA